MRSKVLLVANFIASLYFVYLVTYFGGSVLSSSGATEVIGGAIATALVMPHMIMFGIGAIFGWVGYLIKASWSALVAAILYAVGTVLFVVYFMFGVPILILGFVGYSKQKKLNKQSGLAD